MTSLADRIKEAELKREEVTVPEWADVLDGAKLFVRELTGAERGKLEADMASEKKDLGKVRLQLVAMTLTDEAGEPVFKNAGELAELSGSAVGLLSDTALSISGFTGDALDDAVKN